MTREREKEIKQMNSPRGFKNKKKKGQNQTRTKPEHIKQKLVHERAVKADSNKKR